LTIDEISVTLQRISRKFCSVAALSNDHECWFRGIGNRHTCTESRRTPTERNGKYLVWFAAPADLQICLCVMRLPGNID
jgi:hypothetical protein